jgi:hypothetical protein
MFWGVYIFRPLDGTRRKLCGRNNRRSDTPCLSVVGEGSVWGRSLGRNVASQLYARPQEYVRTPYCCRSLSGAPRLGTRRSVVDFGGIDVIIRVIRAPTLDCEHRWGENQPKFVTPTGRLAEFISGPQASRAKWTCI